MATLEAQEAATKARIINHMNADHHDSITRYLEVSEKKWPVQLRGARMTDINLNEVIFSYSNKQATIPFDPPMKSLREARERLVQMDKDSLQTLGRSDINIKTFIPPYAKLTHQLNFTQCLLTYLAFSRAANFRPGSLLFDSLLFRFPAFANFCLAIRPYLLTIMVGIHVVETIIMVKKLHHHGLSPFDRLWWLWAGTCFVEGITSFWRLDGWLEERKREKEAKKH